MSIPADFLSQNVSISPVTERYNTENLIVLSIYRFEYKSYEREI